MVNTSELQDRTSLLADLHTNVVTVTFTKKDGSERVMRCTLQEEFLPAQDVKDIKEGKVRNKTEEVVAVWDLEKEAWRSFRLDSITAVKVA
jgi:hypothetical protein